MGSLSGFAQVNKYEDSSNYKAALLALDKDDVRNGIEYLSKEIAVHPDNGYAYFYLSVIYLDYEDYRAAIVSVNEAIKYLPVKDKATRAKALTLRSKIERTFNYADDALSDLNEAISLCSGDLNILQERADLYYSMEEYDKSDSDYMRMLGIQPGYALAEMGLGRNNVGRERYTDALTQFNKIARKFPDYSQVFAFRAEAYLGLGKTSEAIDDIIKALDIDQNQKATLLMTVVNSQNSDLLLNKFSAKKNSDRSNPLWPMYIGFIKEMNEDYSQAISYYQNSYRIIATPFCAKRISDCYMSLQEWDKAISHIDKAIALDKDNLHYLSDKARILWYADRLNDAISVESKCISLQPDHYFHYYRRGWYKELNGDIDGALEDYTDCLSRNQNYAHAHLNRGRLYLKRGFEQMAHSDLERCVQLDTIPNENSCAFYALFYLGRNSEAKTYMDEVLAEDEDSSFYDAACLYSLMNLRSTALDYLEKAFENGFDNFNHVLRDSDLDHIRGEYRFKQLFEKYSKRVLQVSEDTTNEKTSPEIVSAENSDESDYTEITTAIPFTTSYGITKVKGAVNDYVVVFSYIPGQKLTISEYQAEYFLSNGYIKKTDCSGKIGADGEVPIGSTIKFSSLTIADESFSNIQAVVVDNNQSPLVFGDKLFGARSKVRKDTNRSVITVTRNIKSN